jgi:RNA 3'-terminal phosphate cyclase (ATP)
MHADHRLFADAPPRSQLHRKGGKMGVLTLDGSHGEGGGQILRTALSLSAITTRPLRLVNIRASRRNPGMMPQHIAAVRAAATVSGATVSGD